MIYFSKKSVILKWIAVQNINNRCKIGFHALSVPWMGSCRRNEKSVSAPIYDMEFAPVANTDAYIAIVKGYVIIYSRCSFTSGCFFVMQKYKS